MNRFFSFVRSELFLSIMGGFALGVAGMAMVKPASATSEKAEAGAVLIEGTIQGAAYHGKLAR
jgi:hypothetical protein